MKRILIRSGKSPFHVATPEQVIHQDLIGTNSGNLLFSDAAHKLLLTENTEVTSNGIRTNSSAARAAEINEQYDIFVIPLANAFRPSFQDSLDRLSRLVEQLTIPVVVLGVGAQTGADYDTSSMDGLRSSVKRFAKAVLDRSATIGVRGELTADYLKSLGFHEVEVIGCPSMFYHGDSLPELDTRRKLTGDSPIALNISRGANRVGEIAAIARNTYRRYPNTGYFAQNLVDAELLFWGDTSAAGGVRKKMPTVTTHELLRDGRARVPFDSATWIGELSEYEFCFGTRIHGNIAGLLAGTPSVVLCHDSRTLELCRYFGIPYQMLSELPADTDPAELYDKADFSDLVNGHQERFERLVGFLNRHGLENTYTHGDRGAAYEARIASLKLPEPIQMWNGTDDGALGYRISWLREESRRGQQSVERQLENASKSISELQARNDELETLTTALLRRTSAAEKRLDRYERNVVRKAAGRTVSALRGRVRKVLGRDG